MRRPGEEGPGDGEVRDDADARVREEVDFYLERRTRELIDEGVPEAEAGRLARERFGDVRAVERECRRIQGRLGRRHARHRLLGTWLRDLRFAARALTRRPGYAAPAVATLAFGIGANTAVFSAVNAVLLRPLPFPEPDRLVQVWQAVPGGTRNASPADYLDWRRLNRSFEHLASYDWQSRNLMGVDRAERLTLARVSGNFFATMGVTAHLGRTFGPQPVAEGERVAVLGHGLWTRRFGADPAIVGGRIRLDDETFDVVGVMPPAFDFPAGVELWVGAPHDVPGIRNFPGDITAMRDAWYFRAVGRLSPAVELEAARADMGDVARRLAEAYPDTNEDTGALLVPLHEQTVGSVRPTLLLLLAAVGLVLLIACANVANLLLVRATGRRRELAVRRALGAGRAGIVGHVLAESAVLAALGGVLGVGLALLGVRLLGATLPGIIPRGGEVSVDGMVLVYTTGVAVVTALLFGALPAWIASGTSPVGAMSTRSGGDGGGVGGRRARSALVGMEVALATVLVLTASLVLRSVWQLRGVDLGFEPDGLVTLWASLPGARDMSVPERVAFYHGVQDGLMAIEGVTAAGWAQTSPLAMGPGAGLRVQAMIEADLPSVQWQMVTTSYFAALGLRIVAGRGFLDTDTPSTERVAVISETLARQVFRGGDPLGRLINTGLDGRSDEGEWNWVRVVGVVSDTRNRGPAEDSSPMMYRPFEQGSTSFRGEAMMLALRTEGGGADIVPRVREVIARLHEDVPVYGAARGDELAARYVVGPHLILSLLGGFAILALLLGAVGIYGVTSFSVSRRAPEIGIRMAVGAGRGQVVGLVLRQGLEPSLVGIGVGLALAAMAGRLVEAFLFQVSPSEPSTYVGVAACLLLVAVGATWVPARRAASVDPVRAMAVE